MKAGKWFIVFAAVALLLSSAAMAQSIAVNRLCVHNGGESYAPSAGTHKYGGGKYFPSFLHIPAQSEPWSTDTWPWKISGWGIESMKVCDFPSNVWTWKSCLQASMDNPYSTNMSFDYPVLYTTGLAHYDTPNPIYENTIPAACPDVGGLELTYPSSADGLTYTPYLNIFVTITDVMTIPSTVPLYGYKFSWILASPSVITVPSAYSIYQFTWQDQGDDMQYLVLSTDETDCAGTGGGNKGKNYCLIGMNGPYFGFYPNYCTGGSVEWAQCLFVQDAVSIPVNVPGSTADSNPFNAYGFDVGSATVTPLASSGSAVV
ncbi:MAG: hypothetical protein ACYTG7_16650, partial [Planctomycetota bacterium]